MKNGNFYWSETGNKAPPVFNMPEGGGGPGFKKGGKDNKKWGKDSKKWGKEGKDGKKEGKEGKKGKEGKDN